MYIFNETTLIHDPNIRPPRWIEFYSSTRLDIMMSVDKNIISCDDLSETLDLKFYFYSGNFQLFLVSLIGYFHMGRV